METINIINNLDYKIIMKNMLITNQYKLIVRCHEIYEFGYLSNKNLTIEEIKEFINSQKFINWDLFIDLINLDFQIYKPNTKIKLDSLEYLVSIKSTNLIKFLLDIDLNNLNSFNNLINWDKYNKNIFLQIFKNFYNNDIIINKTIDLIIKNNYEFIFNKKHKLLNKSTLFYAISKCSELVVIRLFYLKLIDVNWEDNYSNNLIHWACKRNFNDLLNLLINKNSNIDLDKVNKGNRTALHIACIKNNIYLVKILVSKNVNLEIRDNNSNYPLNYAIKYCNTEIVKLLLEQNLNEISENPEILYQMIEYQNESMVKHLIDCNIISFDNTNFVWTLLLFANKKYYYQMYSYCSKKILSFFYFCINDFITTYDGHIIDDTYFD
jgi:hypothetical protein